MSTRTLSNPPLRRLLGALFLALCTITSLAHADEDSMAPYRERFKAGMERYKAGDLAAAISDWESIYREVGTEKGYRVAFDLARAYDKLGNLAHAEERYQSFLTVVDAKRSAGLALESVVLQEENEARERLAKIASEKGPAHPEPTLAPESTPAPVTSPSPPPSAAPAPPSAPPPGSSPPPTPAIEPPSDHPFSPVLLFVAGGVTVAAIAACAVEYANAPSAEDAVHAVAGQPVSAQMGPLSTYDNTKTLAYGTLAASISLAAITGGLTAWYLAGTKPKTRELSVAPVLGPLPGGAQAGLVAHF